MKTALRIIALTATVLCSFAATAMQWQSRSIYQVLTDRFARTDSNDTTDCDLKDYCGGTFVGLKNSLPYIALMGFDAIWISPIPTNSEKGYHGYWATDLYNVNDHYGTHDELKDLIEAAHAVDIFVMLDVVANHMAPIGVNFGLLTPFNESNYYNPVCNIGDWLNQTQVENCRLFDLPDLNQNHPFVRETLKSWVNGVVNDFYFDGIRIDTVPEVSKDFWAEFAASAEVFQMGEVADSRYDYVAQYQGVLDSVLNYPLYYQLLNVFKYANDTMLSFRTHYKKMSAFENQDLLGVFVDNHDQPRFLNYSTDLRQFRSALAFTLCSRGIPIIYYGSEADFDGGNDPYNREPFWEGGFEKTVTAELLTTINNARRLTGWYSYPQEEAYADTLVYAFKRGKTLFAFTNKPDTVNTATTRVHPFIVGQTVCNVFGSHEDCQTLKSDDFAFSLTNGEVKIFVLEEIYNQIKNV